LTLSRVQRSIVNVRAGVDTHTDDKVGRLPAIPATEDWAMLNERYTAA